jgi:putative ABC transport system permease protein
VQKQLGMQGMEAGDVRQIKHGIQTAFADLLLLISVVPFAAMAVASFGVANTIMASIRSRRWQLGVLRSIGLTQSQLLRLVLAEALLVGIVGCALGIAAGSVLAIDAREMLRVVLGVYPPVAVPWGILWIGTLVVMIIALLAALWPAITTARTAALTLLQAGRSSA